MGADIISSAGQEELAFLHERLSNHFADLRDHRRAAAGGAPVFALEHGLSDAELVLLKTHVVSEIREGRVPEEFWLPLVVYAAAVGYEYSGDEYWQTFEARTPGWVEYGDRSFVRDRPALVHALKPHTWS